MAFIAEHPDRPLKLRALARELAVAGEDYGAYRACVRALLDEGLLQLGAGRTLRLPALSDVFVGVFRAHRCGYGFVQTQGRPDVFVAPADTRGALDGDEVQARLVRAARPPGRGGATSDGADARRGRAQKRGTGRAADARPASKSARGAAGAGRTDDSPRAEIVRILRRAPARWIGRIEPTAKGWRVRPRGNVPIDAVAIQPDADGPLRAGDLVLVEPVEQSLYRDHVRGVVTERFGDPTDYRNHVRAILRRYGIPEAFPPEVSAAARRVAAEYDPERALFAGRTTRRGAAQVEPRVDLRGLRVITIDPPDARDFDDAISIEPGSEPGTVELGVHIADVAYFVTPDGVIDREARQRGTSVYFPGYVVPMLPEALSNGVCSLQPGEPRLSHSVFITYDQHGQVRGTRFAAAVICSAARLTYEEVDRILTHESAAPPAIAALLFEAERLAQRIRQRRLAAGMVALNLPEVALRFDADGRVIFAGPADRGFSHTLIEMFMVEANESVSRRLAALEIPHLRRVHPELDEEDSGPLRWLLKTMGRPEKRLRDRGSIRELLDAVRDKPAEPAVHYVLLRSFAQAKYSPARAGHFALASEDYCHFTSPIRRYPDLTVHRLLHAVAAPGENAARHAPPDKMRPARSGSASDRSAQRVAPETDESAVELAALGLHASQMERRAQQAEREARHALLLEFMKGKLGREFDAFVTGVTSFGVFVQLQPHMAEGVIPPQRLGADAWRYDPTYGILISRNDERVISLGQRLRVVAEEIDDVRMELIVRPARQAFFSAADEAAPLDRPRPHPAERKQSRRRDRKRGADRG